jgi:chromosome partitioning protein
MILAIANHKGGVGKTTTVVNLSAALAEAGKDVLVVDADPQAHATVGLGVTVGADQIALQHVLLNPQLPLTDALQETHTPGVSLLPATVDLAATEPLLASAQNVGALKKRHDALAAYDFTILDCPPSLGHLTLNTLMAADGFLIVVDCGGNAVRGLVSLLSVVKQLQRGPNPSLAIIGVLVNEYDRRTNLSRDMLEAVREHFGLVTFQTIIPRRTDIERANNAGQSVLAYAPRSEAANAYRALATEVISRAQAGAAP